ncbi:AMP-binding protein [Nocardioides terrisoli]|uniref:AMP-binding protein n=1 Tax=Nocardioides terrisoli TaxID=3388267 RepID=UPI00287B9814|nr:AMP-binding protein [Nocardioides marmorisolisilvae]
MSARPPTDLPLSPVNFLRRSAVVFPERVAVVDGDIRITYAAWLTRVRRMAGLLAAQGVKPGDCVALLAPNSRMLLDAHFGVALAGATVLTLNIRLTADELTWITEHASASVLLYDHSLAALASRLPASAKISDVEYEELLIDADEVERAVEDEYASLALNYTSGTTGRPRGVIYHHRGAHQQALAMAYHAALDPSTVHLWTLPMFHCNGWGFTWAVTAAGGRHVCLRQVRPDAVWRAVQEEGVTSLNAAPTVLIDLAASSLAARVPHRVLVGTGGAPPSPTLLGQLGDLGFDVRHYYGLTETFGPSVVSEFPPERAAAPLSEQASFKARQGNANIAGAPVRVVDDAGRDVPADGVSVGEIVLTGNTVALGYHRDPVATAEAFGSGWFRTGDLGVMHPDNYIELRDRAKDVIISGGENIASVEVEQALATHPDVLECAVVGAPHDRWGEVPVAFVTLRSGASLTSVELIAWARKQLPGFKAPKEVVFGDLPKTGTGKIQKFQLRAQLRADG